MKEQIWQEESMRSVNLKPVLVSKKLWHLLKHLFFIGRLRCRCGWTLDVLTSLGYSPNLDHTTLISHTIKQHSSSDETFFHWCTLCLLTQVLHYAKHVLLFWNVGPLMSINTSNTEEQFLWNRATFGGVIVLGSRGKVQISIFFFGQAICSWKGFRSLKILMIKALQSVFTPRTNSSGKHLRTSVITDLREYLPLYTLL